MHPETGALLVLFSRVSGGSAETEVRSTSMPYHTRGKSCALTKVKGDNLALCSVCKYSASVAALLPTGGDEFRRALCRDAKQLTRADSISDATLTENSLWKGTDGKGIHIRICSRQAYASSIRLRVWS